MTTIAILFWAAGTTWGQAGTTTSYNVAAAPGYLGIFDWPVRVEPLAPPSSPASRHVVGRIFNLSGDSTVLVSLIQQARRDGLLEFAELNRVVYVSHCENALGVYSGNVNLHSYPYSLIGAAEAQKITRGGGVIVGVVDTGTDYGHPDLAGKLWANAPEDLNGNGAFDESDLNGVDDDGNGYVDDVIGYDFVHQPRSLGGGDYLFSDSDPMDDNTHGTMVAGLLTSVMPEVRVMTVRAFAAGGGGEDDDVARALVYAADNGAKVINCSFGDIYPSLTMRAAMEYALSRGVTVVASAGQTTGDKPHYPSDFLGVISVSATGMTESGEEYFVPLSNFGPRVALSAPGAFVRAPAMRTYGDSTGYAVFSGTSVSAPLVSAAAAALLALQPGLSSEAVKIALISGADDLSIPGWDFYTGAGRLNIPRALQWSNQVHGAVLKIHSPPHDAVVLADSLPVVVSVAHPMYQSHRAGNSTIFHGQTLSDTVYYIHKRDHGHQTHVLSLETVLANGKHLKESVRFRFATDTTKVDVRLAVPIWEENVRKAFVVFRSDERAQARLEWGGDEARYFLHDRWTRNGEFLLPVEKSGAYRYRIYVTSGNDTLARTEYDTLDAQTGFIAGPAPDTLFGRVPMGLYLNRAFDFDGDGKRELILTRLDNRLVPQGVDFWERQDTGFALVDSIRTGIVLIKDAADFDGDGIIDLLANFSDNIYIFSGRPYPTSLSYSWERTGLFPARWVDLDGTPPLELIAKDSVHYYLCRFQNGRYFPFQTLFDPTRDYFGSTAPNALFGDFNQNGRPEVVFMDGDGDIFVYENDAGQWKLKLRRDDDEHGESSDYLAAGDFDGDGRQEFFSAVRPYLLRNEADFEYRPRYWRLRIYEPDSLDVVWEDYVYNVNSDSWNAVAVGDLDGEKGQEIVFSSFPRTYVVHWKNGYRMRWFGYGGLTLRHAIADWDGDGNNELAAGRGDSTFFLRFSPGESPRRLYLSARAKTDCEGKLRVELEWEGTDADFYVVYEGEYDQNGTPPETLTFLAQTADARLSRSRSQTRAIYVVEAYKAGARVAESYFADVWVRPSFAEARALSDRVLSLRFDGPLFPRDYDADQFRIGDNRAISAIVSQETGLLLTFEKRFSEGKNVLSISDYRDGYGNSGCDTAIFFYHPEAERRFLIPVRWGVYDEKNAWIEFNAPLDEFGLENFELFPFGTVMRAEKETDARVRLTISTARFGPTGEPLWVRIARLRSLDGRVQRTDEGDVVNFSILGDFSSGVYVYPNPVKAGERFEGCRFAGVPRGASIAVLTVTGTPVRVLKETEGLGGVAWDLKNARGEKIQPGAYRFVVTAHDGKVLQKGGFCVW